MPKQTDTKPSLLYRLKNFISSPTGIALAALFWSVCITGIVYLITTTQILRVGLRILQAPTMLLLNILPVLLVILLLFFATRKLFFSVSLTGSVLLFFAVADRIKVSMRQEPLLPTDLTLVKETTAILKTFPPHQIALIALMIVGFIALIVLSFLKTKPAKLAPVPRIIGLVLVIVCAFGANSKIYADKGRYDAYPTVDNPYFQVNQYNTKGMIYSFLHQYNITQMTEPEGYSKSYFAELENTQWNAPENKEYPHIIMIMGEAFCDMSENPHLNFAGYRDPLQNFKAICSSDNAYSGHIVVPNFGGGTSNTEYDVLTGCGT
ncbi:MAG: hypothetical protein IKY38_05415, partial [Anaerotignum sp.]|nr:hypothetical protein [Anaerotignum sp.]